MKREKQTNTYEFCKRQKYSTATSNKIVELIGLSDNDPRVTASTLGLIQKFDNGLSPNLSQRECSSAISELVDELTAIASSVLDKTDKNSKKIFASFLNMASKARPQSIEILCTSASDTVGLVFKRYKNQGTAKAILESFTKAFSVSAAALEPGEAQKIADVLTYVGAILKNPELMIQILEVMELDMYRELLRK